MRQTYADVRHPRPDQDITMEITVWDIYFAQAVAMFLHPGTKNSAYDAVEKGYDVANHMIQLRWERKCQD